MRYNTNTNTYNIKNDCVEIITKKGQKILIDIDDFEKVKQFCWHVDSKGYAQKNNSKNEHIRMHRFILNTLPNYHIDHINRNKLDNRKCNLRIVTPQENQFNRGLNKNNKSGHNGVYFNKQCKKWCAQITKDRKTISAGLFENIEDALKARQQLEQKYFKNYCLNGIDYELIKKEDK